VLNDQPANDEVQHQKTWEDHFDVESYDFLKTPGPATLGRDFVGWTSMYDGKNMNKAEMNEWLDDTIAAILNGSPAENVPEIGAGTGMILFNLTNGLQSYVGLETSKQAVDYVNKMTGTVPLLRD
jgi:hypothetical protein